MASNPASVSVLALTGCLACLGAWSLAQAQPLPAAGLPDTARSAPAGQRAFDIPGQPLHDALQLYSAATGRSLLYDSAAVTGRVSTPVSGFHTPEEALRQLIAGTGLAARYTSPQAFLLLPEAPGASTASPDAEPAPAEAQALRQRYFGEIQARVMNALCGDPATAPGGYRLAMRFRIDGAHTIRQLEVHASEGSALDALDARVRARLAGLDLGSAPPAQLRQPVTLLLLPTGSAC